MLDKHKVARLHDSEIQAIAVAQTKSMVTFEIITMFITTGI